METKTLQEQIDKFFKETGYQLVIKDGKPYYGGCLDLEHSKVTELPDNLVVGGYLDLYKSKIAKLPENLVVGGYLDLNNSEITKLPDNLVVGGGLYLKDSKIVKLPNNLVVGMFLDLERSKITELPDNLVVGGWIDLRNTNITKLPENLAVGGYLNLCGTKISKLPKNLIAGGYIYGISNRPMTFVLSKDAMKKAQQVTSFLQWNVGGKTYIRTDNIFSVVDSRKGNVWRTHRIGKEESLYVVTDGEGHYAHGNTLKEAKDGLIYKINDRDTSLYENLSLDDEVSFEEAIAMYRTITGACVAGTRDFVENRLPEPHKERYTIREVIELTDGEYGSEKLKKFF